MNSILARLVARLVARPGTSNEVRVLVKDTGPALHHRFLVLIDGGILSGGCEQAVFDDFVDALAFAADEVQVAIEESL